MILGRQLICLLHAQNHTTYTPERPEYQTYNQYIISDSQHRLEDTIPRVQGIRAYPAAILGKPDPAAFLTELGIIVALMHVW
jgi:hypothetical protein